jgi:hypothetical protein
VAKKVYKSINITFEIYIGIINGLIGSVLNVWVSSAVIVKNSTINISVERNDVDMYVYILIYAYKCVYVWLHIYMIMYINKHI